MPAFGSASLAQLADAGACRGRRAGLAITTDSFVVKPLRFPGGSIGELAVNGTVNDLAVAGARPLALASSLVLEEGLAADDLRAEVEAIAAAADAAGVEIVAGDTKVVERGRADGMYVSTTGSGGVDARARALARRASPRRPDPRLRLDRRARHGDHARARRVRARGGRRVRHALALARGRRAARRRRPCLRCLRDATRGGVASVLNELARASGVAMIVREATVPVQPAVAGAASCSASTRCTSRTRASSWRSWRRGRPARARGAARRPGLRGGGGDRRGEDGAARHGARRDRLRRQARDGPARRRPAAADLLRADARACAGGRDRADRRGPRAGRRVLRVEVKVGRLRQVVPRRSVLVRARRHGTAVEGAELVLEDVPAAGHCRSCGAESRLPAFPLLCGMCGELRGGCVGARNCSSTRSSSRGRIDTASWSEPGKEAAMT